MEVVCAYHMLLSCFANRTVLTGRKASRSPLAPIDSILIYNTMLRDCEKDSRPLFMRVPFFMRHMPRRHGKSWKKALLCKELCGMILTGGREWRLTCIKRWPRFAS